MTFMILSDIIKVKAVMLSSQKHFYTTKDVIAAVGISRLTLYRWLAAGKISEVPKDYKEHRLFTQKDIKKIKQFMTRKKTPKSGNKRPSGKKWSATFLALPGTWEDSRTPEQVIQEIYASRHDKRKQGFYFP